MNGPEAPAPVDRKEMFYVSVYVQGDDSRGLSSLYNRVCFLPTLLFTFVS